MAEQTDFEGVLLIDKPAGITSHDVVDRVRRVLRMKRVGHAGTLDPMATGLMLVLVGKATKLSQYLMSLDKEYEGTVTLGVTTNTHDADGEVVSTKPVPELTEDAVLEVMDTFIGDQYQTPPMFSAIKKEGVPLYKLARKGREIEREPRFIRISEFELLRFAPPELDIRVRCSKGTYIRTLAHDLGEKIGCGGHLSALRRTAIDRFSIDQAIPLDEFQEMEPAEIRKRLLSGYDVTPGSFMV
ncbi:MAG: tRNA pseudouridine(55) synthase TruB [Verrucomicrobia bacterium]|nr:MAG: tRNA pseudouridine(55) synthase TruB [Verrucomicrobiota bacterium]